MSQTDVLTIKIEHFRDKLTDLINNKATLTDKEIVKASQELDKHIQLYYEIMG